MATSPAATTRNVPPSFSRRRIDLAVPRARLRPRSVNVAKVDPGLLAELDERQPEVGVPMQVARCRPRRTTGTPPKSSQRSRNARMRSPRPVLWPNRVAQRHPRPALDAVHHERRCGLVVEQQRLVPQVARGTGRSWPVCAAITRPPSSRSSSVGVGQLRAARTHQARASGQQQHAWRRRPRPAGTATPRRGARTATRARAT